MLGFEAVDIGLFEGRSHLWPSREFAGLPKASRRLSRHLADRGLAVADVFLQMAPDFRPYAVNHPQATRQRRARDWFLNTLEYAAGCGARHVTTLPGVRFPEEPLATSWRRACDELAWRVQQARPYGIVFAVEPHLGSIAPRPQAAVRLVREVPGLTLTLDYTHFARAGLHDSEVEPLLAYATHFHARGARKGRLQVSFDDNVIDYCRILDLMRTNGYEGYLGIEYVWTQWERCNEVDNLSETIRFRDFFRASFARGGTR
jgi:sugar phosphate isomerase/epimerase